MIEQLLIDVYFCQKYKTCFSCFSCMCCMYVHWHICACPYKRAEAIRISGHRSNGLLISRTSGLPRWR